MNIEINQRELATILAALRYYQDDWPDHTPAIRDIADDDGLLIPLDREEIDVLCERLNTEAGA